MKSNAVSTENGKAFPGIPSAESSMLYGYLAVNAFFLGISIELPETVSNLDKFFIAPLVVAYAAFLANRVRISLSNESTRTESLIGLLSVPAFVLVSTAVSEIFGGSGELVDFTGVAGALAFGNYVFLRLSENFLEGRDGGSGIYVPFSKFVRFVWLRVLFPALLLLALVGAAV